MPRIYLFKYHLSLDIKNKNDSFHNLIVTSFFLFNFYSTWLIVYFATNTTVNHENSNFISGR